MAPTVVSFASFCDRYDQLRLAQPPGGERVRAVRSLVRDGAAGPALALADDARHAAFQDAPWNWAGGGGGGGGGGNASSSAEQPLYRVLAARHRNAKFVLTVRPAARWWASVRDWLECHRAGHTAAHADKYTRVFGASEYSEVETDPIIVLSSGESPIAESSSSERPSPN